jgi:hypothetical protein
VQIKKAAHVSKPSQPPRCLELLEVIGDRILGISWKVLFMDVYDTHAFLEPARPQVWLILDVRMRRRHEEALNAALGSVVDWRFYEGPTFAMACRIDTHPVDFRACGAVIFEQK